MKKIYLLYFVTASMLLSAFGFQGSIAEAVEGDAVTTNGVVSFYEAEASSSESTDSSEPIPSSTTESTTSSTTDTTSSSKTPTPNESSDSLPNASETKPSGGTTSKPAGSYPSTGELVKKSLMISGAVIIALVLFLFWKRKKARDEEVDHS